MFPTKITFAARSITVMIYWDRPENISTPSLVSPQQKIALQLIQQDDLRDKLVFVS